MNWQSAQQYQTIFVPKTATIPLSNPKPEVQRGACDGQSYWGVAMGIRIVSVAIPMAMLIAPGLTSAQSFDWNKKPIRILLAGGLNNWADFCSGLFHFDRVLKKTNETLEPKIHSYLLLSPTPMREVERWVAWFPYMNPKSDVAKPSMDRASDALLAAHADPSAMAAAEKLYNDTLRSYFFTVFGKCRLGAEQPFIAENFYSGTGDFDAAMARVKFEFAASVKSLDER